MNKQLTFATILFFMILTSCNEKNKNIVQDDPAIKTKCGHLGTLKDMTGLDGCTWFIVTEEGRELAPVNWDKYDIELKDGMRVSFDADLLRDQISICMAEDAIVRLSCFEVIDTNSN